MSDPAKRRRGRKRSRTRASFYDMRDTIMSSPPRKKQRSKAAITPENVSKALNRGIRRSSRNSSGNFRGYPIFCRLEIFFVFSMGPRAATKKGLEKRSKNWVPQHGKAFIEGKKLIYANDKAFLKKIGWNAGENPQFKKCPFIEIPECHHRGP